MLIAIFVMICGMFAMGLGMFVMQVMEFLEGRREKIRDEIRKEL